MRAVLTLFEGVATGAADGYARMAGRPAATLLHLGPGLANGLANLHNARRGGAPLVNVVGDHSRSHKRLDAPLESDIDALAGTVSGWVRRSLTPADVAADAAEAVAAAASTGSVATLILPGRRLVGGRRRGRRAAAASGGRRTSACARSRRSPPSWPQASRPCCSSAATSCATTACCWPRRSPRRPASG